MCRAFEAVLGRPGRTADRVFSEFIQSNGCVTVRDTLLSVFVGSKGVLITTPMSSVVANENMERLGKFLQIL
jgi:hypothetical protein